MADYSDDSSGQVSGEESAESVNDDERDEAEEKAKEDLLRKAKECFAIAEEAEAENRRLALEDLEFSIGKQWPDAIKAERDRDGRPCLVINRLPQFIQQLTNDQRQNRPSIKVHPVDDQADVETAKIIQGLIRHIEYNSNAEAAYDTAFESAARAGWGYFRIITDYSSPTSFDQEILIKRVRNPFSVYLDPFSQEPDGSDASWAFISDDVPKDTFDSQHPDSKLKHAGDAWRSLGDQEAGWVRDDGAVRVAEYFYKELKEVELVQLSTGEIFPSDQIPPQDPLAQVTIVKTRKTKVPVIKWCKFNGYEILEQTEWPGSYIPIIPVYGTEVYVNGKRTLEGIVRNAKDPQRMLNYWKSAQTEAIALAPRAPFIAAEGQIEGYEQDWETANRRNHPVLQYKAVALNGTPVPPPQRQVFEPAVQAITQAAAMAADDLKSTTGIYDASLGSQSNETSGVAIQRRNIQSQTSNFHFVDNLTRSLKHAGRILVDLIPKIYDTERVARIIGDDGDQKIVKVNAPHVNEKGETVLYQLDAGKYDVTVDVGPSFASKRQEAVAAMLEVARAFPPIMQVAGDLFVKNQDWPGAPEIAERLKKMLPPQLQDDGKGGQNQIPPQVQSQMQQMSQMIDSLSKELHAAHDVLDQKKVELESKERIEFAKIQADLEKALLQTQSKEAISLLEHQIAEIQHKQELLMSAPMMQPQGLSTPSPQDSMPLMPAGGTPALGGLDAHAMPTGGQPPGLPLEGIPSHDE